MYALQTVQGDTYVSDASHPGDEWLMHYGRRGMRWGKHIFGEDERASIARKSTSIGNGYASVSRLRKGERAAEARARQRTNIRVHSGQSGMDARRAAEARDRQNARVASGQRGMGVRRAAEARDRAQSQRNAANARQRAKNQAAQASKERTEQMKRKANAQRLSRGPHERAAKTATGRFVGRCIDQVQRGTQRFISAVQRGARALGAVLGNVGRTIRSTVNDIHRALDPKYAAREDEAAYLRTHNAGYLPTSPLREKEARDRQNARVASAASGMDARRAAEARDRALSGTESGVRARREAEERDSRRRANINRNLTSGQSGMDARRAAEARDRQNARVASAASGMDARRAAEARDRALSGTESGVRARREAEERDRANAPRKTMTNMPSFEDIDDAAKTLREFGYDDVADFLADKDVRGIREKKFRGAR